VLDAPWAQVLMHVQVTVGVSGDAGERMPIHSALTRGFATVDEASAVAVTVVHPADAASTRGVAHPKPVILPGVPAGNVRTADGPAGGCRLRW
jgi:hypothetical protein